MEQHAVRARVDQALCSLLRIDLALLQLNASERAIAHALAVHMQSEFAGWDVDCEYNRHERQRKVIHASKQRIEELVAEGKVRSQIPMSEVTDLENPVSVYPDIIVHRRGDPSANLLVLELKKDPADAVRVEWDRWKLGFYTGELGYLQGVLLTVPTGDGVRQGSPFSLEWFCEAPAILISP